MANLYLPRWVVVLAVMFSPFVSSGWGQTYEIDPAHSSIDFKIRHLGISWVRGSFGEFSGTVSLDASQPEKSRIDVTVKAASINTNNDKRDGHLRSEDYFSVEKHPTLTFTATSIKKIAENTYEAVGNFTMLGVSKPITITLTDAGEIEAQGQTRRGAEVSEFTIKRSEFGMNENIGPIGDTVHIYLAFSAVKK
ncbi:MAG: YceI family protein [Candidatus Methylacidiphilales bacterium]